MKRNVDKISIFWSKPTPSEKCQFCGFLKPMFSYSRKACLLYNTSKIVFSRFIFSIYYMGTQGVTRGYKGLQGFTGGLQGVKRGDRGLKGLYKLSFWLERSQIRFLALFWIKIKVEEISNFWPNDGLTPLKKCQFCGFLRLMFSLSRKGCLLYKTPDSL